MKSYRRLNSNSQLSFHDAVLLDTSQCGDITYIDGLPSLPQAILTNMDEMSLAEIAYIVFSTSLGNDIPPQDLNKILKETFTKDVQILKSGDNEYIGPIHNQDMVFHTAATLLIKIADYLNRGKKMKFIFTECNTFSYIFVDAARQQHHKPIAVLAADSPCRQPESKVSLVQFAGSMENRRSVVRQLHDDIDFLNANGIIPVCQTNIISTLTAAVFLFSVICKVRNMSSVKKPLSIVVHNPSLALIVSSMHLKAFGLKTKLYFSFSNPDSAKIEQLESLIASGIVSRDAIIIDNDEKSTAATNDSSTPVVIIESAECVDLSSLEALKHGRPQRIARNYESLRNIITNLL